MPAENQWMQSNFMALSTHQEPAWNLNSLPRHSAHNGCECLRNGSITINRNGRAKHRAVAHSAGRHDLNNLGIDCRSISGTSSTYLTAQQLNLNFLFFVNCMEWKWGEKQKEHAFAFVRKFHTPIDVVQLVCGWIWVGNNVVSAWSNKKKQNRKLIALANVSLCSTVSVSIAFSMNEREIGNVSRRTDYRIVCRNRRHVRSCVVFVCLTHDGLLFLFWCGEQLFSLVKPLPAQNWSTHNISLGNAPGRNECQWKHPLNFIRNVRGMNSLSWHALLKLQGTSFALWLCLRSTIRQPVGHSNATSHSPNSRVFHVRRPVFVKVVVFELKLYGMCVGAQP